MRALVQRVSQAAVDVEGERVAQIGPGMLVLLGVAADDGEEQADRLADKVRALRIFDDAEGRMNEPLGEREVLCVSQFTLYGDASRGNRPSYVAAAPGEVGRAAVRPLLRAARREEGRLRRLHGRRPGQRRAGHGDARGVTDYDTLGLRLRRHRRADPRIAAIVERGLGDARSVVNIGAGAGPTSPATAR